MHKRFRRTTAPQRALNLAGIATMALLAVACGGSSSDSATEATTTQTAAAATTMAPQATTTATTTPMTETPTTQPPTTQPPTTTPVTEAATTMPPTTVTADPPATEPVAQPAGAITRQWHTLMAGQCLAELPTGTFVTTQTVECAGPHAAEVFFAGRADPLRPSTAEERCLNGFASYTGSAIEGSGYDITWIESEPDPQAGGGPQIGDFHADLVVCLLFNPAGAPLTGSLAA